MAKSKDTPQPISGKLVEVDIKDEMRRSFIDYAMSVIVGRALPDVRDGLKPVHRRVLYAMREMGLASNKPYRKSAGVVGEVLKNYQIKQILENGVERDTAVYQEWQRLIKEKNVPVIGMITRLIDQKGLDLIADKFHDLMKTDSQFILQGTGEQRYHELFRAYAKKFPSKVAVKLTFDEQGAHEIEAGADMFLMPSRFEPCGLNQLYSLKYGAVPIVRSTGGLADTITDARLQPILNGNANGFSFKEYNADVMLDTVMNAMDLFKNKSKWTRLMRNGMTQDWSWEKSAKKYYELYKMLVK